MSDSQIALQIERSVGCITAQLVVLTELAETLRGNQDFDSDVIKPDLQALYDDLMALAERLRTLLDTLTGCTGRLADLAEELLPKRGDRRRYDRPRD